MTSLPSDYQVVVSSPVGITLRDGDVTVRNRKSEIILANKEKGLVSEPGSVECLDGDILRVSHRICGERGQVWVEGALTDLKGTTLLGASASFNGSLQRQCRNSTCIFSASFRTILRSFITAATS